MKYNNIKTQLDEDEGKYLGNFNGDVNFIMGPISIYQFNAFADHGLCAVRLFQYIRTKQGLVYGSKAEFKGKDTSHLWVYIDNRIYTIGSVFINQLNGSCLNSCSKKNF